MTTEEKAKAYDEALERARKIHNEILDNEILGFPDQIREIFPELRESEDERTRNEIIAFIEQSIHRGGGTPVPKEKEDKWFAYLEKQKEQKPTSFNEPYNPDEYEVVMEGNATSLKRKEQKPIEDVVKDITKNKESAIKFLKSAGIMDDNGELAEMYRSEQKPVDYDHEMWKNCEANFEGGKKEVIDHPEKYGLQKEQKPAEWSQEDEKMLEIVIANYEYMFDKLRKGDDSDGIADHILIMDWLKSLRPQPHWKPSEEQMNCLCAAVDAAIRKHNESVSGYEPARILKSLYEQLKKIS